MSRRRVELLDQKSTGTEKRLLEVLVQYHRLCGIDQDSWGKLLKTKAYKRRVEATKRIYSHFKWVLARCYPKAVRFEYSLVGSKNRQDVIQRRNQRILLIVYEKD